MQPIRHLAPLLAISLLAACGEGASTSSESSFASLSTPAGAEISGDVAQDGSRPALLVFALVTAGPASDSAEEPQQPSVALVGDEGEFVLSGVAPGSASLVFLDDSASDGVIDDGDPVAVLRDENLRDLHAGDRVHLVNVHLDFHTQQAAAEQVEVTAADPSAPTRGPEPTPTPTPQG